MFFIDFVIDSCYYLAKHPGGTLGKITKRSAIEGANEIKGIYSGQCLR